MPTVKRAVKKAPKKTKGIVGKIGALSFEDTPLKVNAYGKSGTGKTTFACTFPKPLLLIGAEDGTKSVYNVKGIDFVRIEHPDDIGDLADHVSSTQKYKTVVMDSATSLQDMVLKDLLGLDELPVQKSWGMASREIWGQCALKTKEYLRALLNLDVHVIVLAQEREFNTEDTGDLLMPFVASALSPSVVGWLNPACDYIVQTLIREKTTKQKLKVGGKTVTKTKKTGGVEYCIRTAPNPVYTTKFRVPKGSPIPEVIVDPSYSKMVEVIKGK